MIFTGFTDVNGNVIPVQGAGTVYDEEKNSLALGKGTVAIGQDQLVFGRHNETDAAKAEVVGGGKIQSVSVSIGDPILPRKAAYQKFYGGKNLMQLASAICAITGVDSSVVDLTDSQHASGFWDDYDFFLVIQKYMENPYEYMYVMAYSESKGIWTRMLLAVNNSIVYDGNLFPDEDVTSITFGTTATALEYLSIKEVEQILSSVATFTKKNIRTLAWDGTQWNAGDITCDDGNGNIISMRDLLSRIATLEAAAANS